jgi:hypothetical protein
MISGSIDERAERLTEWSDIAREKNLGRLFMFALLFYHTFSSTWAYLVGTFLSLLLALSAMSLAALPAGG